MITQDQQIQIDGSAVTANVTLYGLSTDQKPTDGIGNGSIFIEMNTGKAYFFNGASSTWLEVGG